MFRRMIAATAVLMSTVAPAALASGHWLSGPEIHELLAGNTLEGQYDSTVFRQYFNLNGLTDYSEEGAPVEHGEWWTAGDQLCIRWDAFEDPSCLVVRLEGDQVVWKIPGMTFQSSMTLLRGRQLF